MDATNRRHEVMEWHRGFVELLAGKPFDVRKDNDYNAGDLLVVREHRYGELTGRLALFRIDWVARGGDHNGAFEALIPAGVAVLGLSPANVMVTDEAKAPIPLVKRKESRTAA